ncbi:YncE family protein [Pseudobdellovibrio sp. HCB154]|uniref:YncE family protein n=1 Tax=Pseudobdellovibrio sp. HCB154 TaxID=3386277 RepID=UPI0039171E2E
MKHNHLLVIAVLFSLSLTSCLEQKEELPSLESQLPGITPGTPGSPPSNPPVTGGCDSTASTLADAGYYIPPGREMIPLCDGDILLQDPTDNTLGLINVGTQQVKNVWQLTATPSHMVMDEARKYVYIALVGASKVARIDVSAATNTVDYISTSAPASWLALGESGFLFANLSSQYWGNVDLLDLTALSRVHTFTGSYYKMMVYNKSRKELIMSAPGLSPASLYRYSFDPNANTLTQVEYVFDNGSNANYMAISPDFQKFALSAGAGNSSGYVLFDYNPASLTATNGTYNVGAYPKGAAFTPDSNFFVTTNASDKVKIFNTTTHALVREYTLNTSVCSYATIETVKFSAGGKTVYVNLTCGFNDDSGILLAFKFQ